MLLPYSNPQDSFEGLPEKAILVFQKLVACPQCDCVYVYRASDFHFRQDQPEDLGLVRSRIACAETICDAENCEAHIEIHMPLGKGKTLETARDAISRWVFSPGDYQLRWLDE
jgi:hypothetical protein